MLRRSWLLASCCATVMPFIVGCPNYCEDPTSTTNCSEPGICHSKTGCYDCCTRKHGKNNSPAKTACLDGCDDQYANSEEDPSQTSCSPTTACQTEYYDEIFAALPSYFADPDLQQFVCSLSVEEQSLLLSDIQSDALDHLAELTEENFDEYLLYAQEEAEDTLDELGESGLCAYKVQFNAIVRVWWFETYHAN
ncbi:MAG: hypothetical protein KJ057_14160 [Phycisphaerae bacterium]|nr:MAG: hypothetical protein F9K17_07815 [Phycisphaerae bacterium]MBE7458856.1 hypothetical protein [Planctomycetia bacterium]MCK6465820.1 hypothetical protein [Phycisphaerae bacterium]MCL4719610.1 hypothetical protein [Phycisphaerae bacterium]NUQ10280.1 hypothetical protein [Phycisphaerae bacterium]